MISDLENIRNNCLTSHLVSFKTSKSSIKLIKNLKFKNIKTSEIFVLEDLLAKSQIELNLRGVAKVYNSKLKERYIRTLPNKFLEDNLG
ncbi:hypothetical protein [Metamycoplasma equirhinis]|uniref:hypothetical protein n=1 Tax=Metamycoplasma equirhinis TaxID=92402 RepID=UPI003593190E